MAKADLGTKRTCPNCGTKYYDLNHSPIVCPKCGTRFDGVVAKSRQQAAAVVEEEEEIEVPIIPDAEIVPLEDADAEAADTGAVVVDADDDEAEEEATDDTFLEEEEEGDDDVSTIIGDVDEEER